MDRLPDGFPPFFGTLLRLTHADDSIEAVEQLLRENGFLKRGVHVDLAALRAYLGPLAEPSRVESFKFTREWMRQEAARITDMRSASVGRRLNLPPSYVLIHRVSTAGIGVLCQLECEGAFRAEVIQWMPGYLEDPPPRPGEVVSPTEPLGQTSDHLPAPEVAAEPADLPADLSLDLPELAGSLASRPANGAPDPGQPDVGPLEPGPLEPDGLASRDLDGDGRVSSETADA